MNTVLMFLDVICALLGVLSSFILFHPPTSPIARRFAFVMMLAFYIYAKMRLGI